MLIRMLRLPAVQKVIVYNNLNPQHIALKGIVSGLFIGSFVGLIIYSISPSKNSPLLDIALGILGAFLSIFFINNLKTGFIISQVIGALILILIGRILTNGSENSKNKVLVENNN